MTPWRRIFLTRMVAQNTWFARDEYLHPIHKPDEIVHGKCVSDADEDHSVLPQLGMYYELGSPGHTNELDFICDFDADAEDLQSFPGPSAPTAAATPATAEPLVAAPPDAATDGLAAAASPSAASAQLVSAPTQPPGPRPHAERPTNKKERRVWHI